MNLRNEPALDVKNLSRHFGSFKALDSVSFSVNKGETLAVFGHNGAGKTTLLKILSTVMKPSGGRVSYSGVDSAADPETIRRQLGVVSHRSFLYLSLTAWDNLAFYARLYGIDCRHERISEMLDRIGLKHRAHDRVGTFSRGMIQRMAIARALLHRPEIVLLDEPESGLDVKALDILWRILKEETRTIIFTHHSLERGFDAASRVMILAQGRVFFCPESTCSLEDLRHAYGQSLETR